MDRGEGKMASSENGSDCQMTRYNPNTMRCMLEKRNRAPLREERLLEQEDEVESRSLSAHQKSSRHLNRPSQSATTRDHDVATII